MVEARAPHVHAPHASVLGDGVLWCACGWLSTDPPWLHIENADKLRATVGSVPPTTSPLAKVTTRKTAAL